MVIQMKKAKYLKSRSDGRAKKARRFKKNRRKK